MCGDHACTRAIHGSAAGSGGSGGTTHVQSWLPRSLTLSHAEQLGRRRRAIHLATAYPLARAQPPTFAACRLLQLNSTAELVEIGARFAAASYTHTAAAATRVGASDCAVQAAVQSDGLAAAHSHCTEPPCWWMAAPRLRTLGQLSAALLRLHAQQGVSR